MKQRTCKICKVRYTPEHKTLMALCSAECIVKYPQAAKRKERKKGYQFTKIFDTK